MKRAPSKKKPPEPMVAIEILLEEIQIKPIRFYFNT